MRRVLDHPAAVYAWLLVTLVAIVAALFADAPVIALAGWVVGGVVAVLVAAVRTR